jgi:hypothetical protein
MYLRDKWRKKKQKKNIIVKIRYLLYYREERGSVVLRRYDTRWKVVGAILDEITEFFIWHNPSSRTTVTEVVSASKRN